MSQHDLALFSGLLDRHVSPSSSVLEVGAGTGRFTLPMLERGLRVRATDQNTKYLDHLLSKARAQNLADRCAVEQADLFALPYHDHQFDVVVAVHIIPRLLSSGDQHAAIDELARVLRPGGTLIFNFRNNWSPYRVIYRGHAIAYRKMHGFLRGAGLKTSEQIGKWVLTRRLIDSVPFSVAKTFARVDRALWRVPPHVAWDIFVVASKI